MSSSNQANRAGESATLGSLASGAASAAAAPFPLGDTFDLHSNPGSNYTIYLDFGGHDTSSDANYWARTENGGDDFTTQPYDTSGDFSPPFTNSELDEIQRIWQRVAEDFIPFNLDVTTAFPGLDALDRPTTGSGDGEWGQRAVISGGDGDWKEDVTSPFHLLTIRRSRLHFGIAG